MASSARAAAARAARHGVRTAGVRKGLTVAHCRRYPRRETLGGLHETSGAGPHPCGSHPGARRLRFRGPGAYGPAASPRRRRRRRASPSRRALTEAALLDAVFRIDVERIEVVFDLYPAERRAQAQAAVTFRMRPGQARPIVHFGPVRSVRDRAAARRPGPRPRPGERRPPVLLRRLGAGLGRAAARPRRGRAAPARGELPAGPRGRGRPVLRGRERHRGPRQRGGLPHPERPSRARAPRAGLPGPRRRAVRGGGLGPPAPGDPRATSRSGRSTRSARWRPTR